MAHVVWYHIRNLTHTHDTWSTRSDKNCFWRIMKTNHAIVNQSKSFMEAWIYVISNIEYVPKTFIILRPVLLLHSCTFPADLLWWLLQEKWYGQYIEWLGLLSWVIVYESSVLPKITGSVQVGVVYTRPLVSRQTASNHTMNFLNNNYGDGWQHFLSRPRFLPFEA